MRKKTDVAKLLKQARKSLGLNGDSQQDLLRKARKELGLRNDRLAEVLQVKLPTLMAYLAPENAAKHRRMKEADKLLLQEMLALKKGKVNTIELEHIAGFTVEENGTVKIVCEATDGSRHVLILKAALSPGS